LVNTSKQMARSLSCYIARQRKSRRGVLVCSAPVPERNRGDQALLAVVVDELERRGAGPLTLLTTSNHPIESLDVTPQRVIRNDLFHLFLTRRSFREEIIFPSLVFKHRHLVMIGADVLDEGYSIERSVASMHAIELANRVGVETRIFGFSVNGPPSAGLQSRMKQLGQKTRLFVRDPESFRRLESVATPGIEAAGDLAFLLHPAEASELQPAWLAFAAEHAGRLIGLNLTQVVLRLYGGEETRLNIVAEACRRLALEDGLRFFLIPHDEPEGIAYLRSFQHRLEQGGERISILIDPLSHSRCLKRIAGMCEHVFTCRLHLGIATLGMGRPMTGFPYQGKFEGQFELFGLSNDGLIGPDQFPKTAEEMFNLMRNRISQSDSLALQVQSRLPSVLELSRRNFDGLGTDPSRRPG